MTQLPIVFIPTDAVKAHSTHGAVGGIWQSVITPRKVLINGSTIKQQLLFMMDARHGMLADVEHISLHLVKVLNFSISILHIPASNL